MAYLPAWIMFFVKLQPRKSRVGSTIARGRSTGLRVARWICRCVVPFQGVTGGRMLQRGLVFVADLPATLRIYVLVDLGGPACR